MPYLATLEGYTPNYLGATWLERQGRRIKNAAKDVGNAAKDYLVDPIVDGFNKLASGVKKSVKKWVKGRVVDAIGNKGKEYFEKYSDNAITAAISPPIIAGLAAFLTTIGAPWANAIVVPMVPILIKAAVHEVREEVMKAAARGLKKIGYSGDISEKSIDKSTAKGEIQDTINTYMSYLNSDFKSKGLMGNPYKYVESEGVIYLVRPVSMGGTYQLAISPDSFKRLVIDPIVQKANAAGINTAEFMARLNQILSSLQGYTGAEWLANFNRMTNGRLQMAPNGVIFSTPPTQAIADSFKPKPLPGDKGSAVLPIALGLAALKVLG